jgi:predicted nucleotidyltransferase
LTYKILIPILGKYRLAIFIKIGHKKLFFKGIMMQDGDIKRIIDYFRTREEVSALYLFGSVAKGIQNAGSDIDIAVLIDERKMRGRKFATLRQDYYAASPRLSMRILDIVLLNTAPPHLKHHIIKTGSLIFDRHRRLRVKFAAHAILEYLDYKPVEDICLRAVSDRFRRGAVG